MRNRVPLSDTQLQYNRFKIFVKGLFKPFLIRTYPFVLTILSIFAFPKLTHAANINFSLEAWLKPTTSIATKAILVKNNEIRLVTDASGYLVCQIHNGADWQTAANSGAAIELNKWSQAGCSYDGLNLKVYINGVLKGTTAMRADVQNTTNSFFAGKDAGGTYGRFRGTMDSIAIYDDALTSQEFADHYSRGNLYKDENNNLKFEIGNLSLSYDISSWTSGGWHMITALWNPDGINQVSGSSMLYGNLFVDGASAATSSTAFTTASSLPSTFYFAQDSQSNGQFGGTIYGLQLDENNWKAGDITTAYNSGTGIAPVASGKTNFTLSTASSTDVVAWQHSGSLANDGNFEDGDAADWSGYDEGAELVTNGTMEADANWN
ncbi:MAG: LamG domain-containing protein, partial [bacterium]